MKANNFSLSTHFRNALPSTPMTDSRQQQQSSGRLDVVDALGAGITGNNNDRDTPRQLQQQQQQQLQSANKQGTLEQRYPQLEERLLPSQPVVIPFSPKKGFYPSSHTLNASPRNITYTLSKSPAGPTTYTISNRSPTSSPKRPPGSPHGPKSPMPSQGTIEAHTKSIRFHPYKSTRPDLLYKIKGILAVGSRDLDKKFVDQDVPEQEWVNLYSTAFEEYIQASTMYQAFLRETKTHYDKHIEELANKVLSYRDFDETLERKEKEHESTLQRSLLESKQRIRELEKSSANLNNNFGSMYSELQTTTEENKLLVDRMDSLKREVTSCKLTIQSLTQSLQRVDEEKSKAELKESSLTLELNDYRRHELTMAAENYELQKSIEEKNRIHGTLLHPSVLEAKHRENEALKEEHQRLLYIHRQLLVRFAALKYTIDGSITKIMTTRHEDEQEGVPSSERFHLESLVDKLLSEYRDVLRRESIKVLVDRKTPMEKLSELVTSTHFPQVLFESLMDHLELMMVEKAKILSDEAIQIGTRICMSSICLSCILLLPSSQLLHHITSHHITSHHIASQVVIRSSSVATTHQWSWRETSLRAMELVLLYPYTCGSKGRSATCVYLGLLSSVRSTRYG